MKNTFLEIKNKFNFKKCSEAYNLLNDEEFEPEYLEHWLDELFEYMMDFENISKVSGGMCWEIEKDGNGFLTVTFSPFSHMQLIEEENK